VELGATLKAFPRLPGVSAPGFCPSFILPATPGFSSSMSRVRPPAASNFSSLIAIEGFHCRKVDVVLEDLRYIVYLPSRDEKINYPTDKKSRP
jgi:hypothetical protein